MVKIKTGLWHDLIKQLTCLIVNIDYETKRLRKLNSNYKNVEKIIKYGQKSVEVLKNLGDELHRRKEKVESEKITANNKVWLIVVSIISLVSLFIYNSHSIRSLTYELGMQESEIKYLKERIDKCQEK